MNSKFALNAATGGNGGEGDRGGFTGNPTGGDGGSGAGGAIESLAIKKEALDHRRRTADDERPPRWAMLIH